MPWYIHLYHATWLAFFIALGIFVGWTFMFVVFGVMAITIFLKA